MESCKKLESSWFKSWIIASQLRVFHFDCHLQRKMDYTSMHIFSCRWKIFCYPVNTIFTGCSNSKVSIFNTSMHNCISLVLLFTTHLYQTFGYSNLLVSVLTMVANTTDKIINAFLKWEKKLSSAKNNNYRDLCWCKSPWTAIGVCRLATNRHQRLIASTVFKIFFGFQLKNDNNRNYFTMFSGNLTKTQSPWVWTKKRHFSSMEFDNNANKNYYKLCQW